MDSTPDEDIVGVIEDGETEALPQPPGRIWRLLVVDDDEEVHLSTAYSLRDAEVMGRRLVLTHARSGMEAADLLRRDADFAVILLDVVMETDDAGLRLVRLVRDELGLTALRIILRTGQPGYAPELAVIRDYDINDYRTKAELTRSRLMTSLYTALRAYSHIQALETNRRGLEQIVRASAELFRRNSLTVFCEGILIQLGALLDVEASGIVLARTASDGESSDGPVVLAAAGPFRHLSGCPLNRIGEETVRALLMRALEGRCNVFAAGATVLHIVGPSGDDLAVYLAGGREVGAMDCRLLEVFSSNVAFGFDNAALLDRVRRLAYYDPLTGLPNRTRFQDDIRRRLSQPVEGERLVVLLVDLDHFQAVNDGLGHEAGDALLRAAGSRLGQVFGDGAVVGRLTGDMYGVLLSQPDTSAEDGAAAAVLRAFQAPLSVRGAPLSIKLSGGYAVTVPDQGVGVESEVQRLLRRAGMALKLAKKSGRGRILRFESIMEEELQGRLTLVSRLAEAQATGQFSLVYQPQIRLADGDVAGVEALLRWRRPDGTWISPDAFIPAAEDAGHIVALGEWVLRQACRWQVGRRQAGLGRLRVAVNVSVRQIRDGDMVAVAERVLAECGADPADIELEITESHAMEDGRVFDTAKALRDFGFRIAIDDFGTGYSSLARLQQLPASLLKIDRSFVTDLDRRPDNRSIASMVVKMGHELGLEVLAEGVETADEERVLRDLACDSAQGYLYGRPMPPDDLDRWLDGRRLCGEAGFAGFPSPSIPWAEFERPA